MPVLVGPFLALAFTLLISGLDKLLHPDGAADALRAARLTRAAGPGAVERSRVLARSLGAGETSLGTAAVAVPFLWPNQPLASAATAGLVGAGFLGFAWFVTRLAAIDASASCGCFGSGAPPGPAHRRFNLGAGALGTIVAGGIVMTSETPRISLIADAGVGAVIATTVLLTATVSLMLLAPGLLSDTNPRHLTEHDATVPAFSVTHTISGRR